MKCEICNKRNKNRGWDSRYCSHCGLYLKDVDRAAVTKIIDEMLRRWNSPKKFVYYETSDYNGEIIYRIKYKGVKKIIDYIFWGDQVTLKEAESLIQLISYLSLEFEYNITKLAITLFWYINDNLISCRKILNYWIKVGQREKCRYAFDAEYCIYIAGLKEGKDKYNRRCKRIRNILRHLPNDLD